MSERLKEINLEEVKMSVAPLIDMTFLLLIFFILTIKFKVLEGKLAAYLPKDVGINTSPVDPKEKVEVKIEVVEAGVKLSPFAPAPYTAGDPYDPANHERFIFQFGTRKLRYSIGPQKYTELEKVQERLADLFAQDRERPATIDCRPGTVYGDMVPVLDAAYEVGYRDITFVGEYKPAKPQ
ncbi:MAG: biopolymer transporter ExbD [Planctomycetota bacterium]